MRTRFLRGTTADNNGLTQPSGELTVDLERKALRIHDGSTLGGFEIVGTPIDHPVAGPTTLQAGDSTAGFYGEVNGNTEFITYSTLSTALGISAGTLSHDAESAWLKFSLDGQVMFVAKKNVRHSIVWDDINTIDAVYGGASAPTVNIGGKAYIVRLIKGSNSDPAVFERGSYDPTDTADSEWTRLLYRVHSDQPVQQVGDNWANYTDADLDITNRFSWCQEGHAAHSNYRVLRGEQGINYAGAYYKDFNSNNRSWRPVLVPVTE